MRAGESITGDRVEEVIMSFCSPHPAPPRPAMVLFVNNALIVLRYQTSKTAGQSSTLAVVLKCHRFNLKPGDGSGGGRSVLYEGSQ